MFENEWNYPDVIGKNIKNTLKRRSIESFRFEITRFRELIDAKEDV